MNIEFDTWFKTNYQQGLTISNRFDSMYLALNYFLEKKGVCIVETGTMRMDDNWLDGKSTWIFGSFCQRYNCQLHTVDIDAGAVETSRRVTRSASEYIHYAVDDSVLFLKNFEGKIDLLYLDSMNCPPNDIESSPELIASQQHQLLEIEAAFDKLSQDAVVLLDDNDFVNGGKTKFSKVFLRNKGLKELMSWKQSLWLRR